MAAKQMKAVRLTKFETPYEVQNVDIPELGDNDLLVKIGAAGFCHTDYQVWEGVYKSPTPLTPGHEPVGTVAAIGPSVNGWNVGDRVGVLLFRHACKKCLYCVRAFKEKGGYDVRFCENASLAGLKDDGAMAEYMIADAANTVKLPDSVPFEEGAPLLCAGTTVWGAIQTAKLKPSTPVGVVGIGGLGSLAIQFLKALGHPTVAIDRRPEALDLAVEVPLVADLVIDSTSETAVKDIIKWAGGEGLPTVIVCTDNVDIIAWSLKLLRVQGKLVSLGLPTTPLNFDAFDLVFKELSVLGSLVATVEQAQDMMKVVDKFGIKTHVRVLDIGDAPRLPDLYMDQHLKGRLVIKM